MVPEGSGGVRISQISGVQQGTLYPGVHLVVPFVQRMAVYDLRDHLFTTTAVSDAATKNEVLTVQTREGLTIGLAVSVRYRLDPQKLAYIHANLAQPVDSEIVAPVVSTAFRDLAPNYVVREVFAVKRDEFRAKSTKTITDRLGSDGIVVKEVLLRDVHLPAEYAKGLEDILLKEQESERMEFETAIYEKQVKIAELQAEAAKAQQVKHAEADAESRVIGGQGRIRRHAIHAAAQAEADRGVAPRSPGAQGSHRRKCRGRRAVQSDRQQSGSRARRVAGGLRRRNGPLPRKPAPIRPLERGGQCRNDSPDGCGRRRAACREKRPCSSRIRC